jgi:predicted PurR-regulated permease PerM
MQISAVPKRATSNTVIAACCLLALLHFGRDVLRPIALAIILSLVAVPLVRAFSRTGLRRLHAMLVVMLLVVSCLAGTLAVLTSQFLSVSAELPRYRVAIQAKADQLRTLAERPFVHMQTGLNAVVPGAVPERVPGLPAAAPALANSGAAASDALTHLAALAWGPLGEASMVFVLLLFILLEHESLQDRVIRLAGHTEISRTIRGLADAAQGVSRFFFCQFVVNITFGAAICVALWSVGVPHALLWGALSSILRFVPYLGALAAGGVIACFAAAIDPGWSLALSCAGMFSILELLVANVVEPKVYGHSTGLSPLAVIISALFWGTLWGPIGLLISTPLTVCLVVAGRHVSALEPLAIMFGQTPDVTAAQRFFQRSLSGETGIILRDAQTFLRHNSFARYCDQVLLPGLALAVTELQRGLIDEAQQHLLRCTVVEVAEFLADRGVVRSRRRRGVSLLDASVGAHLRQLREARLGRWQGSLDVPQRSVILCVGLASERDELVSELLARSLRETAVDARSLTLPLPYVEHDTNSAELVSNVFIPYPLTEELEAWQDAIAALRLTLPHALIATVRLPGDDTIISASTIQAEVDMVLRSFEECLAFVAPKRDAN